MLLTYKFVKTKFDVFLTTYDISAWLLTEEVFLRGNFKEGEHAVSFI